ncbi:S8 family serine peptidase [Salegentibacter sp. JZCK2]|uniref:S8 family peptidase n=1 Tax=Salegentibacter tibetensis TaxID=2873600 RepID=UPI001CC9F768|nr:S8 family peptidase [Salegentibacter tibetensis]MBZ9730900.1 S8 family serine peptidase [Salegentibacter tibetensis]
MAKKKNPPGQDASKETIPKGELIVIAKQDAGMRSTPSGIRSTQGAETKSLQKLLKDKKISLTPLFGKSEEALIGEMEEDSAPDSAELHQHLFYYVEAPEEDLEEIKDDLLKDELIDGAYIKPFGEPPTAPEMDEMESTEVLEPEEGTPTTPPDFTSRQGYLNPAPEGIDARYAWGLSGGKGSNVRIIDCEWGWRFNHIDLLQNRGGVLSGTNSTNLRSENHGTAVIGEYSGDHNHFGISGICPQAWAAAVSFSQPTALAIRNAANRLRAGDIMLLEIHRAGPKNNFQGRDDQDGYIAIEWWPDDYEAIRYAVNKGIIVVSAAGNGGENLDGSIYNNKPNGFPSWWKNPFKRDPLDSGSILVGAGAPPPNTHGRNHGADRSRLGFSNYGSAIDAQGWGREVTTTGYGGLWRDPVDPNNRDRWFTDTFSGTSSASPIVVGALGCVQGYLKARGRIPLTPSRARNLLRSTGSPQQSTSGRPRSQRIGNRPNLRQMIAAVNPTNSWVGVQFTGTINARQQRRWFTFRWPAHWHVVWTVMPTTPRSGAPQVEWKVQVERASDEHITYWITVKNLTAFPVRIEGRYAVLGW